MGQLLTSDRLEMAPGFRRGDGVAWGVRGKQPVIPAKVGIQPSARAITITALKLIRTWPNVFAKVEIHICAL
jgi:hypothetical protein